jgi:hypothetical protein
VSDLVEEYGEALFGRRLRLRVLLWVLATPEIFNQTQAARGVDYGSVGEVAKELERLVKLGMLRKYARLPAVGPQRYAREEGHPMWGAITAVHSALRQVPSWRPGAGGPDEIDAERPNAPIEDIRRGHKA